MSFVTVPVVGFNLATTSQSIGSLTLGQQFQANDGVYVVVQASGAITQYSMVKIDDDFQAAMGTTTLLPSTEPAAVGIAQVAFADNDYGWVFVGPGLATCRIAATCAADVVLNTTATAGAVDDASGTAILGLKLIAATTAASTGAAVEATVKLATVS